MLSCLGLADPGLLGLGFAVGFVLRGLRPFCVGDPLVDLRPKGPLRKRAVGFVLRFWGSRGLQLGFVAPVDARRGGGRFVIDAVGAWRGLTRG